jgi:PKD repeat protein
LSGQFVILPSAGKNNDQHLDSLHRVIKSFSLFTVDTKSWMHQALDARNELSLSVEIEGQDMLFYLEETHILDHESSINIIKESGVETLKYLPEIKSYKGATADMSARVRLTIADGFVYGNMITASNEYFIEPLQYFTQAENNHQFVIYNKKDVLKNHQQKQCFRPVIAQDTHIKESQSGQRNGECYRAKLAILADYSMYVDAAHSGVQALVNHLVGVVNNVEDNYEYNGNINFTDGVTFRLSEIVISACTTCDPVGTYTDAGLLLSDFSSWIDKGGFYHAFHGAHLWTNRELNGSTIGVAFQNANLYCQSKARALFQDWTSNAALLKTLVSHEMGHTFHAVHDQSNTTTIMAPTISTTNTLWSANSRLTISEQIANQGPQCMNACTTVPCNPVANIVIDSITTTNMYISWSASSSGMYTIRVREVGQAAFIMDFTTTNLSVALAPSGYAICKKYDVFIYNNCATNGLSLPERIFIVAPTSQGCANFTANKTVLWLGNPVVFSDESINANSWLWNFGNGQTSTLQNPTINYTSSGVYTVSLTVNGTHTKTHNAYIKVLQDVDPPFTLAQGGDFETNEAYFASAAIEGNTDFWQLGTSTYELVTNGKAWKTGLNSDITQVTTKSALFSPRFNFLGYQQFELHFDIGMQVQYCNAPVAGQIQYSTNNGLSWTRLGNSPGFYNAGTGNQCKIAPIIFPDSIGWTFTSNYVHKSIDVSFLAGQPSVIFRIVLGVSGFYNDGYSVDGMLIDNFRLEATGLVPLALKENSLVAKKVDKKTALTWETDQSSDIVQYIIMRSGDDLKFEEIGSLYQNNVLSTEFKYEDQQPLGGNNYYKVGAKNIDGSLVYSNIVKVNHTFDKSINAFPNPVKAGQEINIELEGDIDFISDILFFDMVGRPINVLIHSKSDKHWILSLKDVGVYWYKCWTNNGDIVSTKIVVL